MMYELFLIPYWAVIFNLMHLPIHQNFENFNMSILIDKFNS